MKSKRRHELEHNALADWLGTTIASIQPYQNLVVGVVLVLALGGAVYAWWSRQSSAQNAQAWDQFFAAFDSGNVSKLGGVAEQFPNTPAGHWAAVVAADSQLSIGCDLLFANKAAGNDALRKAVQFYLTVLGQTRDPRLLERATYGLARAYEALGELDKAGTLYQQIGKDWPHGAYAAAAANRRADVERPSIKAMYDRFAKFEPKPPTPAAQGIPGQQPPFKVDELPEEGPLFEPGKAINLKAKPAEEKQNPPAGASVPSPQQSMPEPPAEPAATPSGKSADSSKAGGRETPPEKPVESAPGK